MIEESSRFVTACLFVGGLMAAIWNYFFDRKFDGCTHEKLFGIALIVVSTIVFALITIKAVKSRAYGRDILALALDAWEVAVLYLVLIILGLVLIFR